MRIKGNINIKIGLALALVVIIPALIGLIWTPFDPNLMDKSLAFSGFSLLHPFGCDNFGRDLLSRIMTGSISSIAVGLCTIIIGATIGTIIGATTGYYGGMADEALMRINDVILSFPSVLMALVIVSLGSNSTIDVVIALGIAFIPSFARVVRGEFLREKNKNYVLMARLAGAGDFRIIFVHILPNTIRVLVSALLIGFNNAILAEAGLSFLGIGVRPPFATLGSMLNDAQTYLFSKPSYAIIPGVTIIILILGISMLGEELGKNNG